MNYVKEINIEIKNTDNDNINKSNSQETNILNKNNNNIISNDNTNSNDYPIFKNRLKALFSEFNNEQNNKIDPAINFSEKILELHNGCKILVVLIIIAFICCGLIILFPFVKVPWLIPIPGLGLIISIYLICCFQTIQPGEALVLTYYGKYIGTCKEPGFFWIRPCTDKKIISLKSNHYNGNKIKVNDKDGTPVLIGLVCIWRINDTVKATYSVKDYTNFLKGQTESGIRYIANKFSYDSSEENEPTLKSGNEEINTLLKLEIQRRTKLAGILIEDARITEISYGNEIASLMLQKQAANSHIYSQKKIAASVVEIIDDSIKEIKKRNICTFKDEEKNKLISNMMVILNMGKDGKSIVKI